MFWSIYFINCMQLTAHASLLFLIPYLGTNFGNLTLVACPTIELAGVPNTEAVEAIVWVGVIDILEEPMSGRWGWIKTIETLGKNIRGATGVLTDSVAATPNIVVVVAMFGDVIKGVTMDTGFTLVDTTLTATSLVTVSEDISLLVTTTLLASLATASVDGSLLVTTAGESLSISLEGGTVVASILLFRFASRALFDLMMATWILSLKISDCSILWSISPPSTNPRIYSSNCRKVSSFSLRVILHCSSLITTDSVSSALPIASWSAENAVVVVIQLQCWFQQSLLEFCSSCHWFQLAPLISA